MHDDEFFRVDSFQIQLNQRLMKKLMFLPRAHQFDRQVFHRIRHVGRLFRVEEASLDFFQIVFQRFFRLKEKVEERERDESFVTCSKSVRS